MKMLGISRNNEKLLGWCQLALAVPLASCIFVIGCSVVMNVFDPAHYGLWTGTGVFVLGTVDHASSANRQPDFAFYVATLLLVLLGGLVCTKLIGHARVRLLH